LALNQGARVRCAGRRPRVAKIKTETREAFDRYVKRVEARNEGELKRGTDLLWVDGLPEEQRTEAYAGLKIGVKWKMQKLEILHNDKPMACPGGDDSSLDGGGVCSASETRGRFGGVLEDYDKHSVYYAPDVERSKIESRDRWGPFPVFLRFRRHKVITWC